MRDRLAPDIERYFDPSFNPFDPALYDLSGYESALPMFRHAQSREHADFIKVLAERRRLLAAQLRDADARASRFLAAMFDPVHVMFLVAAWVGVAHALRWLRKTPAIRPASASQLNRWSRSVDDRRGNSADQRMNDAFIQIQRKNSDEGTIEIKIKKSHLVTVKILATGLFFACAILLAFGVVWWPLYI